MVSVAAVLTVLVACGGSRDEGKTPSGARASCASDSECVITNKSGCCAACPEAPHALPTLALEQRKSRCAEAACAPASDRIECPNVDPPEVYLAKCKEGTCTVVKR